MATYYVNSAADAGGNGTTTALTGANCAFKTIAQVNAATFAADDFIQFNRGNTWNETLNPPNNGTSGHPITFEAYGSGDLPVIDGTGLDYCVNGTRDYIKLRYLRFETPDSRGVEHTRWGPAEYSTPGWVIEHCEFYQCGAYLYGPNTIVQDNTFEGPNPLDGTGDRGAIIIRGLVASGCQVLRNTIHDYTCRGVWILNGASTPTVSDNTIYNITAADTFGLGIDFDGAGAVITGTVTCTGNTVYSCYNYGIELENCSDGSVVSKNLVYSCGTNGIVYINYTTERGNDVAGQISYNIVYDCRYLVKLIDVSNVKIWNNVIYEGSGVGPYGIVLDDNGTYYTDTIDIRNNVIGSGLSACIFTKTDFENHISVLDYNCVENPVIYEYSTEEDFTLAELQALNYMDNGFTTAPGFVNASSHDFRLTSSSPCVNTGAQLGLTSDFAGHLIR